MSQPLVRFYVFAHAQTQARYRLVCQLADKALTQAQRVFILCADEAMCHALDVYLWQYPEQAFLPHAVVGSAEAEEAKILLAAAPNRAGDCDVLINLSLEAQADIPRACSRIFEIVIQEPQVLAATRRRYKHYQERELSLETHHLKSE